MNCFTEEQLNRISHLIREIEKLTDVEKLFLYLQLPCGRAEGTEGKSKFNGSKSPSDLFSKKPDQETTQTYTWILSHLEVDPNVSLPKQEVYDEYRAFCQANAFEPLCVADFGKAMKHAFPCIKPRRLGQRGNSRYCYSGLRKKYKIQPPNLPDMIEPTFCLDNDCSQTYSQIIKDCRDNPDECPLNNRPDFTGYEVMNLKIDPGNQQHHQQQHHQQYHHSNGNGTSSGGNYGVTSGENLGNKQLANSSMQSQELGARQRAQTHAAGGGGGGSSNNNHPLASGGGGGVAVHLTPVSGHDYVPSNPMPIVSQASPARFNCAVIQQPGTPDDDDYRHNYQDAFPMYSRHPMLATNANADKLTASSNGPTHPTTTSTTNGFMYHHQQQLANSKGPQMQCHSSDRLDRANGMTTATVSDGSVPAANTNLSSQFVVQNTAQTSHHAHQLYRMDTSSHIDACASPFQSPASTPYPMMGSHVNQEMPDYYSSDCVRYPNS